MKRTMLFAAIAAIAFSSTANAQQKLDPAVETAVRQLLPVCSDLKLTATDVPFKLPTGFTGHVVRAESSQPACGGQFVAARTPTGGFYLGMPWPIGNEEGATTEARLKAFAWRALQSPVTVVIDQKRNSDGLLTATLNETVEGGVVPLTGAIDGEGKVFFLGNFRRLSGDVRAERAKAFAKLAESAPSRGADKPIVTIIEFSDFECPSCKRSSAWVDPIIAAHGQTVRHVRFDVPLSGHPWSLAASVAGRAVLRQKPDLFWEFKKQVYENQETLSAFTIDTFARGFAESHELDMSRYDADVASPEIRQLLLDGAGTAFSNDVRATPTYMVNGAIVEPGAEGKELAAYVAKLLEKK